MDVALKSWELDNNVKLIDPKRDALYIHDPAAEKELTDSKPWKKDINWFKHVRISAVALIKMTRVNAQADANEYLIEYTEASRAQGRTENVVGWYHSHPGYGCWLSGIDVETQLMQQQFTDPFLAVVIDPDRTINAGKVEIGAFRTYPADHKAAGGAGPGNKSESGAYWVQTLSANPLLTNREYGNKQILDLSSKIAEATRNLAKVRPQSGLYPNKTAVDKALEKIAKDSDMIATRERTGLLAADVKAKVFCDSSTKSE
ncbi:unnamed protein product [Parascedosporium putredinis]|uniref:COP9 signalosome complex subunit 5 n=1 Tax=Parascedosporium putredinis TaxID=1442378 RepID=A0A9P1HAT7_9PEZI|nr:unnamed protein product [Parascedosporium putredinis]CAI8003054.1 unnamed protein product [Parascedosporium putredinis]